MSETRWPDSRLDDLANELRALRNVPARIAEVAVDLGYLKKDTGACHRAVRDLRSEFNAYRDEQGEQREAHRLERKSDRRWMIGTVLTAAALVIAAMGLLLGHIG